MAHDLPDIVTCKRVKSGDWRLFSASLPLPSDFRESNSNHTNGMPLPHVNAITIVMFRLFL